MSEFLAVKHWQTLARVKYKGNSGRLELLGMLLHGIAPVGRNHAQPDVTARLNSGNVGLHHRARMKSRDLVVVTIGHDHGLCGIGVIDLAYKLGIDALSFHPRHVLNAVTPHRCHGKRGTAKLPQAVRNIARTAAEFAAQRRDQKGYVEDVQLVGQYLLGKAPLKCHDGVESKGATNYSRHSVLDSVKGKKPGYGNRPPARMRAVRRMTTKARLPALRRRIP